MLTHHLCGIQLKKTFRTSLAAILFTLLALSTVKPTLAWSNGGFSTDPSHPRYGTHDWIAQHALDWLPTTEKQYLTENLAAYLYGTELPDNNEAADRIGDTAKHHIYYYANGSLQEDPAAVRATEEYQKTLNALKTHNYADAAKNAGAMTHYIADVAVFGHVMAANTAWGAETHHTDYEDAVNTRTSTYNAPFNTYLHFDGNLTATTPYDAAAKLAYDTTFNPTGNLTCTWMDKNYNWSNPTFTNRCGESLNLAVNLIADVLHTLYQTANPTATPTPSTTPPTPTPPTTTSQPPTPAQTPPSPTPTSSLTPSPNQTSTPTPQIPETTTTALLTATVALTGITLLNKKLKTKPHNHPPPKTRQQHTR